jgi:hypothetical protein
MQSNSQGTTQVSPRVDSIGKVKAKGESEQLIDSKRTRTVPNYSSTNWLSQRANKAPNNTEGHKAKKARKTQEISGLPDNGRSFGISTKVRKSLKSPSADGRSLSCSSSDDTQCGGDKPQERAQVRNEDNTAELMKKRRLEVEEYSFDSLRSLQSQEEHQLDKMQETLSSVDSPTYPPLTDPPRQRKKRRQHREDDRIS